MDQIKLVKSKFLKNLFDQNTYVLSSDKDAVIIDAGAEVVDVLNAVKDKNVRAILITHLHFDHIWNLENYLQVFQCNVFICKGAEPRFVLPRFNRSEMLYVPRKFFIEKSRISFISSHMKFGKIEIFAYFTPGHAADCVSFLWRRNLFSGDLIFENGIGRTDLPDSDNEKMAYSLNNLLDIDFDNIFPGHYNTLTKSEAKKIIFNL